jgi:hypothetical protein
VRGSRSQNQVGGSSSIQVIYNGENVTPKPLLPLRRDILVLDDSLPGGSRSLGVNSMYEGDEEYSLASADKSAKTTPTRRDSSSDGLAGKLSKNRSAMIGRSLKNAFNPNAKAWASEEYERVPESIKLIETTTEIIFSLPGLCVAIDAKERNAIEGRNNSYAAKVASRAGAADRFMNRCAFRRSMITFILTMLGPHKKGTT